jgi:cellulose synthase/poly-beta-1,6-N-acetylglucosamine synthase-like glycosyltransferase
MRHFFEKYPRKTTRLIEILIPATSWLIITMPFWLSFVSPEVVGYILITFTVYWFYKSFSLAISAIRSFITLQAHVNVDWMKKIQDHPHVHKVHHVIIIPEYKEPLHILKRTIENLAQMDFPKQRIILVLATEEKDPDADVVAASLEQEFKHTFGHFLITRHPLIPGEIAGKSSNMAHAANKAYTYLKQHAIPIEYTTVTSCDADALIHPKYFSSLTHRLLSDPNRSMCFYQGAILFYSNIWRIPLPNRFLNILNSIWNLASLSQTNRLINFSTYSLMMQTAKDVGFWSVDVIPEDYHMFYKVFFAKGKEVHTQPIFLPILVDAAESRGFFRTMINQYEQAKRWAWGVSDIPYVIRGMIIHRHIPLWNRVSRLVLLLEHHIFWPANWFLLTIGGFIPPLVNPVFARTTFGFRLAQLSSTILTLSAIVLLVVFYIDWKLKPPKPEHVKNWTLPFLYLQWFTLPVIAFFLSALPGLDAHTRLLLGKRLEYRVTEKV